MNILVNAKESQASLPALPLPEPMPNVDVYHLERELRLGEYPDCRANYDRYLASSAREADVDYLPVKLDIESVSRCNFRCQMCQVSEWTKGQRADDMTLAEFKSLIDEQIGLVEIKLTGMGAPLMGGDSLFDMIRYARERHIWVRSVTNASLLHLHDNYRKIIDSGINELQVSVDGADKEVFETIRGGSKFEKVVENCRLLNGYCKDVGQTRAKMWTVVQQGNVHQLFELVELAEYMGFTSQVFSLDLTNWGQDDWRSRNEAKNLVSHIDSETGWRLVEDGKRRGIKVSFWNIAAKYDTASPENLCPWPFERAYVSSDSRVVPCCMIANPDVLEIAPIKNGFSEVWQGNDYRDFRRAHIDGNIPPACQNCYRAGV
ncbi:MAG: radical SAM protein [Rhodospirillaceae bacterium]|nr:radical SAM protein [Rhodospirillaceae bacterium]